MNIIYLNHKDRSRRLSFLLLLEIEGVAVITIPDSRIFAMLVDELVTSSGRHITVADHHFSSMVRDASMHFAIIHHCKRD